MKYKQIEQKKLWSVIYAWQWDVHRKELQTKTVKMHREQQLKFFKLLKPVKD